MDTTQTRHSECATPKTTGYELELDLWAPIREENKRVQRLQEEMIDELW